MPWWVKFLWACSRQCRKQQTIYIGQTVQKNNKQFTYGQTVQNNTQTILPMDRQCKKKLHWSIYSAQTVQKKQQTIYRWTDSAKKKTTAIYIWTDSAKNNSNLHMDSTYLQDCTEDMWQTTPYIYSVRLVYYRDILNYQRHIIHRMCTSTLCTLSIHNVVYT